MRVTHTKQLQHLRLACQAFLLVGPASPTLIDRLAGGYLVGQCWQGYFASFAIDWYKQLDSRPKLDLARQLFENISELDKKEEG